MVYHILVTFHLYESDIFIVIIELYTFIVVFYCTTFSLLIYFQLKFNFYWIFCGIVLYVYGRINKYTWIKHPKTKNTMMDMILLDLICIFLLDDKIFYFLENEFSNALYFFSEETCEYIMYYTNICHFGIKCGTLIKYT